MQIKSLSCPPEVAIPEMSDVVVNRTKYEPTKANVISKVEILPHWTLYTIEKGYCDPFSLSLKPPKCK